MARARCNNDVVAVALGLPKPPAHPVEWLRDEAVVRQMLLGPHSWHARSPTVTRREAQARAVCTKNHAGWGIRVACSAFSVGEAVDKACSQKFEGFEYTRRRPGLLHPSPSSSARRIYWRRSYWLVSYHQGVAQPRSRSYHRQALYHPNKNSSTSTPTPTNSSSTNHTATSAASSCHVAYCALQRRGQPSLPSPPSQRLPQEPSRDVS